MTQAELKEMMKDAMRAKDSVKLGVVRGLMAAATNEAVQKGKGPDGVLDESEMLTVITRAAKQRKDSIEQFSKAGRTDLVNKETAEIAVLETYLPPAATAQEIDAAVAEAIAETAATSPKDIGKVMKAVMAALAGKSVDGRRVNEAVRQRLAP